MLERRRYRCVLKGLKRGRMKDVDGPMTGLALGPRMTKFAPACEGQIIVNQTFLK